MSHEAPTNEDLHRAGMHFGGSDAHWYCALCADESVLAEVSALRAELAAAKAREERLREALRVMWMEFGGRAAACLVPTDLGEVRAALTEKP